MYLSYRDPYIVITYNVQHHVNNIYRKRTHHM